MHHVAIEVKVDGVLRDPAFPEASPVGASNKRIAAGVGGAPGLAVLHRAPIPTIWCSVGKCADIVSVAVGSTGTIAVVQLISTLSKTMTEPP